MRLDNYSVAAFEAFEPIEPDGEAPGHGASSEAPHAEPPVAEAAPSQLLREMAEQPPVVRLIEPGPMRRLPRMDDGDRLPLRQREPGNRFERGGGGEGGGLSSHTPSAPVSEVPAPPPVSAPAPVEAAAAVAAPVAAAPAVAPQPVAADAVSVALPLGPAVSPDWLNQREAALQAVRADFVAAREATRGTPPTDVANLVGSGWVAAPTDGDGNPVHGAVFVPDAAAAAAAPEFVPAWMLREGMAPAAPAGQWLSFDDAAYEQSYRERLAARPEASAPLARLAQLYGEPVQNVLAARPELWALATQDHALNAGAPPKAGVAMGDALSLGQLDLYLADPFLTQLRTQLGGKAAAPTSALALEQQRLYGAERYAELTQLSQAMAAVRQTHAAAMQAARDGGGTGWVEKPLQFGTDPETGWPTGIYQTVSNGDSSEIVRDANGVPMLATQRVFDEALFTNDWLTRPGLAQEAFARFYGQAHGSISLQQDNSESGGPPRWVSQPGLDNPHVALGDSGVWDGDVLALDLNHAPKLNNDGAIGFDPQLGWVTSRDNLYEHRNWFERAMPVVMVAFVSWATAGAASAAGWGAVGSAAAAGAAASFAGGVINGNLSLKGVLIGAVSGALTAGLTPQLTGALKDAGLGAAAGVAARMTVQGGIQALLGGKFKDGAIAGFASGLAELTSAQVGENIDKAVKAGTMSATEAMAARTFNTMLGSAIRAAGTPGDPAQAFASNWLDGLMRDNLPAVQAPAPAPAPAVGDDDGVQAFPVPGPGPVVVTPLPPEPVDMSVLTPRPGESDSEFTVRLMREVYGSNVDLNPAGEHNQYQIYRDEQGQLVVSDGTGLNRPVDPKVNAAFEAMLAQRMQQLNAIAAVQRSQAFSDWAAANNRPVVAPPEPGLLGQRIPVVADVRDFLLAQIDQAVASTSGSGQVALEALRIGVEALTPETYGDAALNELGGGVVKAGMPLAGVLKAAAVESRLGKEVGELLQAASRQGGDVAGHLLGNAAEAEARDAGRLVVREVPGKKGDWNAALNGELKPNATYVLTNGHAYSTDALGRVVKAEGTLNAATVDRNAYQQLLAGRAGGDGYDGGHLIGTLVGGAGEKINLVAQLSSVNRGEFRVMEKSWAEAMQAGKEVRVAVSPVYSGSSPVPTQIDVRYWIDGAATKRVFPNTPGG